MTYTTSTTQNTIPYTTIVSKTDQIIKSGLCEFEYCKNGDKGIPLSPHILVSEGTEECGPPVKRRGRGHMNTPWLMGNKSPRTGQCHHRWSSWSQMANRCVKSIRNQRQKRRFVGGLVYGICLYKFEIQWEFCWVIIPSHIQALSGHLLYAIWSAHAHMWSYTELHISVVVASSMHNTTATNRFAVFLFWNVSVLFVNIFLCIPMSFFIFFIWKKRY